MITIVRTKWIQLKENQKRNSQNPIFYLTKEEEEGRSELQLKRN
ncbi:hypothetical protein HanRHA438_Chr10g0458871 [Helianthus annuus]|nr:hypothetical protein HanRHA438_Chr10g0458871 [Helianthus annuus]